MTFAGTSARARVLVCAMLTRRDVYIFHFPRMGDEKPQRDETGETRRNSQRGFSSSVFIDTRP
eukprot:31265-Pelagococcus_subviridis.AAC.32